MIYGTPSKSNLAFPTDMKIGLITFSQKLLLNLCFQQLESTKFNPHFPPTKKHATHTHKPSITARNIEVNSSHPLALTNKSETGTSNLCHSSVGSVASTPLCGKGTDLSCSHAVQAADVASTM